MADIDMIPRSYRDGVRVRRVLRRTALALAVVVLAGAVGSAWLRWRTGVFEQAAAQLRTAATQAQSDQAREAAARAGLERRARQDALLRSLRREGELAAFARAIDDALPRDAWLTGIALRRDVQLTPPSTIGSGNAKPAPADTAMAGSIVELSGQALDYASITAFLARLGRAPGVAAVQLRSSGAAGEAQDIAFDATVMLAWQDRP